MKRVRRGMKEGNFNDELALQILELDKYAEYLGDVTELIYNENYGERERKKMAGAFRAMNMGSEVQMQRAWKVYGDSMGLTRSQVQTLKTHMPFEDAIAFMAQQIPRVSDLSLIHI